MGDHYDKAIYFSPTIKYNFLSEDCYKNFVMPYAEMMLTISNLDGAFDGAPIGLGGAAGFGAVIPFTISKTYFSVDFNVLYSSPNMIRAVERDLVNTINVAFILSAGIDKIYLYIFNYIWLKPFISSCSSFNRYDDAVRIKSDSAYKYIQNPVAKELSREARYAELC